MVRRFLDQTFPDRWMGRDGPMLWPPRSPDLTPLDFFLWGYVKDIVYRTPVPNIDELIMRITAAVSNTTSTCCSELGEKSNIGWTSFEPLVAHMWKFTEMYRHVNTNSNNFSRK